MAVNCCAVPSEIAGVVGLIVIETRAAGCTVSVADPLTVSDATPIVVVPALKVVAIPCEPGALLMVATPAAVELQCPVWVRSCVLPSV